jgi:hypothetical protein
MREDDVLLEFSFILSCIAFFGVASWAVSCISPWQSIVRQSRLIISGSL